MSPEVNFPLTVLTLCVCESSIRLGVCHQCYDSVPLIRRFTEDENKVLKELYSLHGSNWTTISDKMGRSCEAVQRRFNVMCE